MQILFIVIKTFEKYTDLIRLNSFIKNSFKFLQNIY